MRKSAEWFEQLGSGGGCQIFSSDDFKVTHWQKGMVQITEIRCDLGWPKEHNVYFEGHIDLNSDEDCLELLVGRDLVKIMKGMYKKGIEAGKQAKMAELREVFGV